MRLGSGHWARLGDDFTGDVMPAHDAACTCCADLLHRRFDRRRFLHVAGGIGALAMFPSLAFAAEGNYDAMLLTCIDPRFPEPTLNYMKTRSMMGKYSQFTFAGAAIGVVAPAFKAWQPAFWENLAASIQLHHIPKVIALNHRDCGAAKIAYGADKVANPQIENETHKAVFADFRKQMAEKQPKLIVETGLMAVDGKVDMFS
jgi:carbonic anhydrase